MALVKEDYPDAHKFVLLRDHTEGSPHRSLKNFLTVDASWLEALALLDAKYGNEEEVQAELYNELTSLHICEDHVSYS